MKLAEDVERLEAENRKLKEELEERDAAPKSDSFYDTSVRAVERPRSLPRRRPS
jgi:uncharacterized protein (UPF0335 family)